MLPFAPLPAPTAHASGPAPGLAPRALARVQSEYNKTAIKVQTAWNQLFHVLS